MAAETVSSLGTSLYTPVYTTKAYVFYVSPDNRERWNQTSSKAIDVSIVIVASRNAPAKRDLKLVAVNDETGETILDDVITKTPFDQRSLKFCQWIDNKRLLWGLGFDQEGPLEEFIRRVDLLKQELAHPSPQATLPPTQPPKPRQQTGSTSSHQTSPPHQQHQHIQSQQQQQIQYEEHESSNWDKTHQSQQQQQQVNGQPNVRGRLTSSGSLTQQQISSNSLPPRGENQQQQHLSNGNNPVKSNGSVSNNNVSNISGQHSRSHSTIGNQNKNIAASPTNVDNPASGDVSQQLTNIDQLKYENERLKQALEEISNNAGLWHQELITLRKNNAKLTQALQESKSNVEEWQIELASLRDENKELKLRIRETSSNPDQKIELLEYIEKLQKDMTVKDQDIEKLRLSMDELALSKQKSEDQMNNNSSSKLDQNQKQALVSLQSRMDAKVSELKAISQELTMVVDKISQ